MTTQVWLGYIPTGSNTLVHLDEQSVPGARIYAVARALIPKENDAMATAATIDRPLKAVSPEVIIIDDRPAVITRIGGWFSAGYMWVRKAIGRVGSWGRNGITKVIDTLHLRAAASFVKDAVVGFGPIGWVSTGVAMVTTKRGRDFLRATVVGTGDLLVDYTIRLLHWVHIVRLANWIEDLYVGLKDRISRGLRTVSRLGGGRVGDFFDPGSRSMRFISTVAIVVAGSKLSLMIPMPAPIRLVVSAVVLVMMGVGLIEADHRMHQEKADDLKAAAERADLTEEQKTLVEAVADHVAASVTTPDGKAPAATIRTATQRKDYPASHGSRSGPRAAAKATSSGKH